MSGASGTGDDLKSGENNNSNTSMELTACGDGNSHGNDFGAFDKQILIVRGAESEDEIEGGGDNGSIPQHDLNAIFGRGFKKGSGVVGTSDTSGKEVGAIDDASNKGAGIYGAGQGYGVYGRGGDIPENDAPEFVAVTDNTVRDDYEGAIGVAGAGKSRPGVIGSNEILHKDTVNFKVFDHNANNNPHPPLVPTPSLTEVPVGVLGINKSNTGVFGLSLDDFREDTILPFVLPFYTENGPNPFAGTGVFGLSLSGIGVLGSSKFGYGGWFQSGQSGQPVNPETTLAQLHLEPR